MSTRGSAVPNGADLAQVLQILRGLGDANMQPGGLSLGTLEPGTPVGSLGATWAIVKTSVAAGNVYDVSHSLGRTPRFAMLVTSENDSTPASGYEVIEWERRKWNSSNIRVYVHPVFGTLDGGVLRLLLGGE